MAEQYLGIYKVLPRLGIKVRDEADQESKRVAIIAHGESLKVDEAIPNFQGSFRTRLHIEKSSVQAKTIFSNGKFDSEYKAMEVSGWITMKSTDTKFVARIADDFEQLDAMKASGEYVETESEEEEVAEDEDDEEEEEQAQAQAQEGEEEGEGEEEEELDTSHSLSHVSEGAEEEQEEEEQDSEGLGKEAVPVLNGVPNGAAHDLAPDDGELCEYTVQAEAGLKIRAGPALDSEHVGNLKKGESIRALEIGQTEDGLTRVRFDRGWISKRPGVLFTTKSKMERDYEATMAAKKTSSSKTAKRRMSVSLGGVSGVTSALNEMTKGSGDAELEMDKTFRVLQRFPEKKRDWVQMRVGSMNIQLFNGPKPLGISHMYMQLEGWERREAVCLLLPPVFHLRPLF